MCDIHSAGAFLGHPWCITQFLLNFPHIFQETRPSSLARKRALGLGHQLVAGETLRRRALEQASARAVLPQGESPGELRW